MAVAPVIAAMKKVRRPLKKAFLPSAWFSRAVTREMTFSSLSCAVLSSASWDLSAVARGSTRCSIFSCTLRKSSLTLSKP